MENFGSFLKTHREKKSIRLEEIASITKIHLHSLELLEASQWEQLPPEPFIRGFIIAYAKYVGLEPKDVLDRYYEETGRKKGVTAPILVENPPAAAPTARPSAATGSETPGDVIAAVSFPAPSKIVAAGAAAVAVLVIGILISVGKKADQGSENVQVAVQAAPATPETAPATDAAKPAAQLAMPTAGKTGEDRAVAVAAPKPEAAKPADEFEHEVQIEGKERTWVKVVIDENPPLELFLSENETAKYNAKKKIKVVLGNSAGARVLHNGKPVEGTKFMGTIRSFRFPASAKFPQDLAPKKDAAPAPVVAKPEGNDASGTGDFVSPGE